MSYELAIIGAGNMAEAIARGVINGGLLRPDQIIAADVSSQRRELFSATLKVRAVERNEEAAGQAKTLLLSVKPQTMAAAMSMKHPYEPRHRLLELAFRFAVDGGRSVHDPRVQQTCRAQELAKIAGAGMSKADNRDAMSPLPRQGPVDPSAAPTRIP